MTVSTISEKVLSLKKAIHEEALRAGRPPEEIEWLLITKSATASKIREAISAGVSRFGENRVQDLLSKMAELPAGLEWHFVGHLQTNKVKSIIGKVRLIHSLDREEVVRALEAEAEKRNISRVDGLMQVNASGEASKFGLRPEQVGPFAASLRPDARVRIKGLMTIGPLTEKEDRIRECFRIVKQLQSHLRKTCPDHEWSLLSMGMSQDFRVAIQEGANLLRIGRAVFGDEN